MPEETARNPITVRSVPAGRAVDWCRSGFAWLFADATGLFLWIAMELCTLAAPSVLQIVPVLGWIAGIFLGIVLQAGLMIAARRTAHEGATRFEDLFGGFGPRLGELLMLGLLALLSLGAWIGLLLLAGAGALVSELGGAWTGSGLTLDTAAALQAVFTLLGILMLGLLLLVPITMAFWLAPGLVVLHGAGALEAMRLSFVACLRNPLALLVYGLAVLVLGVAAVVPLGLGLLLLLPWMSLAKYACYRDVFAGADGADVRGAPLPAP